MHFLTSNATSQNFWKMCFIKNIPAILQSTNDQPFLDAFQKLYGFNAGLQFAPSAVTKKCSGFIHGVQDGMRLAAEQKSYTAKRCTYNASPFAF